MSAICSPRKKAAVQVKYGLPSNDPEISDRPDEIIFKDTLLKKYILEEDTTFTPRKSFPGFMVTYPGRGVPWLLSALFQKRCPD